MNLRSLLVITTCCFLLQFLNLITEKYPFIQSHFQARTFILCFQGLMFLVYPILGHIADVYLNKHRTLKCGLILATASSLCFCVWSFVIAIVRFVSNVHIDENSSACVLIPGVVLAVVGLGFFEANAIQFGLDQLLEASTPKLIAFIHWYYWSQNAGRVIVFYTCLVGGGVSVLLHHSPEVLSPVSVLKVFESFITVSLVLITAAILVLIWVTKKHFYIQRSGLNPFKNIYRVLKYSWKHKVPEHRSAFTYWEEDIPPRIDLGKNKYGGPFTTEEVEDTKTFLRILPLLLCLFGYHLAGDGYSAPEQLLTTSCPSLPVLLLVVLNPLHISALVTVVGIPLYRLVLRKIPSNLKPTLMLTRMWIGLYLSLLQVVVCIIVVVNHDTTYMNWQHHYQLPNISSPEQTCFNHRISNHTSETPIDNTYLWFIIPQLLNGLSSLLVSMTVFEFICAQVPRSTQGMLIGLWYATFSIRYLVVGVPNQYITERRLWLICEGVKGFLILVLLVLFSYVSRHYRYRQRDEIVNVQGMIEEIHERRLDQEEEYMKERRAFYRAFNSYNAMPTINMH